MAFCSILLLAACETAPSPDVREALAEESVAREGQVVAMVPDLPAQQRTTDAALALGYTLTDTVQLEALGYRMMTFALPADVTEQQAIQALERAEPTATVGRNTKYYPQQLATTGSRFDYASALLDWPAGGCDALAPVGLIDTGIDVDAMSLASAKLIARRFAVGPTGPSRHGTEVASVLANPDRLRGVTIYNADVFTDAPGGGAAADALIQAMNWLASEDVRIINLSLAGPFNKLLNLAVTRAAGRGMILVAAAGNAGPKAAPQYPAGFKSVIAVTAVDSVRRIYRNAVQGEHIDVSAPGVDVFIPVGTTGRFVTGTSIAAPFVTSRILADPDLIAAANVDLLRRKLASKTEDLGPKGVDPFFGAGLVKASAICAGRTVPLGG